MIHNLEQYSPEWWAIRSGRMTASMAQAIGANGAGLKTKIRSIMAEKHTGNHESFQSDAMKRGLELEPEAAKRYAIETGAYVQKIGFVTMGKYLGVSPDRTADEGLVEIKCPSDKVYLDILLDGKIETKYIWQMQLQMFVCRKPWCDFVAFHPGYDRDIWIKRVYHDKKAITKLKAGIVSGIEMIRDYESILNAA